MLLRHCHFRWAFLVSTLSISSHFLYVFRNVEVRRGFFLCFFWRVLILGSGECACVSLYVCADAIMQSGCILRSVQGTFLVGYHWKVHSSWTYSPYVHSMCERDVQCSNWAESKLVHRHIIDVPYINHGYGYAQYTYIFIVVIVVVVIIIRMFLSMPFLTCN